MWPAVIDVGASAEAQGKKKVVPPAPSIAAFRKKVAELHFTNGSDKEVVADLYEKMLRAAYGGALELIFASAGWGDAEAAMFVESLPLCMRLEELGLSNNKKIGAAGWAALARALRDGAAPGLKQLFIRRNDFSGSDEALRMLGEAKLPGLETLWMGDSTFNLSALVEGMQAGAWPSLEELDMWGNEQASDEGAEALARALERGAMPKLKEIEAYRMSKAGKAAIVKARPGVKVYLG